MNTAASRVGTITHVDCLALLALKVAPRVFDLSSGQTHVSIRDQIVRGQLLVRDLCRADTEFRNLLVVGAGVGGAAAAEAAAHANKKVLLVDQKSGPFSLQHRTDTRFVAPFMYEWPSDFSADQQYPPADDKLWGKSRPAAPGWKHQQPVTSRRLAQDLDQWLTDTINLYPDLSFFTGVNGTKVRHFVKDFTGTVSRNLTQRMAGRPILPLPSLTAGGSRWRPSRGPDYPFTPDYVILAGGAGGEGVKLPGQVAGVDFWDNDTLRQQATVRQRIGIFGGGDGALQDVLRALTVFDHPLLMINRLEGVGRFKTLLANQRGRLQTLETQGRLVASWTQGGDIDPYEQIDESCKSIALSLAADPDVQKAVIECIRPLDSASRGEVILYVRDRYFGKAYLLNRFLVHLIHAVAEAHPGGIPKRRMNFHLHFEHQCEDSRYLGHRRSCSVTVKNRRAGVSFSESLDLVVVRFGVDRPNQASGLWSSAGPLQMIQLSRKDVGHRTSLAQVPLPFVLPG